jgi:transcriptional regulator HilA, main transcriptional regulator of SPI1
VPDWQPAAIVPRYRFHEFIVSPRQRLLLRRGQELPLIPRYFDLLVFLIERRHEAVHRRDIFDRVWRDVVVSDSALSQAVRTIRRALDDDSREPRFIRTVSRHGYRFVFADVIEEDDVVDAGAEPADRAVAAAPAIAAPPLRATSMPGAAAVDAFEPLLDAIARPATSAADQEDQREAAEMLHALGTAAALARLGTRPGHALARALLRDTRWDSPSAGEVPIAGAPAPFAVTRALVALRLRRAARVAALRWAGASIGGGAAGAIGGASGGLILAAAPGSAAPLAVAPVLALIGGVCGALGGAGVGAGMSMAEATARSRRTLAIVAGAALGGGLVGAAAQWIVRSALSALVGLAVDVNGAVEGLVIGAAAGIGYALATRRAEGGLAAPVGRERLSAALVTSAVCALGALALTLAGRPLVGGTIHAIARAAHGSATLTPLGRLLGDPDFGRVSQAIIGAGEGALFGFGTALGLTRRPLR